MTSHMNSGSETNNDIVMSASYDIVDVLANILDSIDLHEPCTDATDAVKDFKMVINSIAIGNPEAWAAMPADQQWEYIAGGARPIDAAEFRKAFRAWMASMPAKHTDGLYMILVASPVVQLAFWEFLRDFWQYEQDFSATVLYQAAGQFEQHLTTTAAASQSGGGGGGDDKSPWASAHRPAHKRGWPAFQHVSLFLARAWSCFEPLTCFSSACDTEERTVMLFGALGVYLRLFERRMIPPRFGKWLSEEPRRALALWQESYAAAVTDYVTVGVFLSDDQRDDSFLVDDADIKWMSNYRVLLDEAGINIFDHAML